MDNVMDSIPTLNLGKGFFDVLDKAGKTTVWLRDFETPTKRYGMEFDAWFWDLPSISDAYDCYVYYGYTGERIIDELLKVYLPLRLFRVGDYADLPLCMGLIGNRGSGKTAGAVSIVLFDYLLHGLPAYSNIDIAVRVKYKKAEKVFRSETLNKLDMLDLSGGYQNGVVLLDEVNMEAGEAQRASSGANLQLGYAVQQIRKRMLSLIWTCQGWGWVDNRLRWQVDYAIACSDAYLTKGHTAAFIGEKSVWVSHDVSGLTGTFDLDFTFKHKYLSDFKVWTAETYIRPFWFCYNTYELKGQGDYMKEYRDNKALLAARSYSMPEGHETPEDDFVTRMKDAGIERLSTVEVWRQCELKDDAAGRRKMGRAMKKGGYKRKRDGTGNYYYQRNGGEPNA